LVTFGIKLTAYIANPDILVKKRHLMDIRFPNVGIDYLPQVFTECLLLLIGFIFAQRADEIAEQR
jgi:hypothetical protein